MNLPCICLHFVVCCVCYVHGLRVIFVPVANTFLMNLLCVFSAVAACVLCMVRVCFGVFCDMFH